MFQNIVRQLAPSQINFSRGRWIKVICFNLNLVLGKKTSIWNDAKCSQRLCQAEMNKHDGITRVVRSFKSHVDLTTASVGPPLAPNLVKSRTLQPVSLHSNHNFAQLCSQSYVITT